MIVKNKKLKRLINLEKRKVKPLSESLALIQWDLETEMPPKAVKERSKLIAEISNLINKFYTSKIFFRLVEEINKEKDLNEYEKRIVELYNRTYDYYKNIDKKILKEIEKQRVKTVKKWEEAKIKKNFKIVEKELEKLFDLLVKKAEIYYKNKGESGLIYDFYLDLFEEGMNVKKADSILDDSLIKKLKELLKETDFPRESEIESLTYDKIKMQEFVKKAVKYLHLDNKKIVIKESAHPFTTKISSNDVRVTTRYSKTNFKEPITSIYHELGHASYELNVDKKFKDTPLEDPVSFVIHESQSRFVENFISKNKAFIEKHLKEFKKIVNGLNFSVEEVYKYFNMINNKIRIEADEISYNLHIVLRYRLEKDLFNGKITINELPNAWNEMSEKILNYRPKDDSEGVLQDIHWYSGYFGYFITYGIANLLSAQILSNLEKEKGKIYDLIKNNKVKEIMNFLRDKVQKYGSFYKFEEVANKFGGLNSKYFIEYLKEKYVNSQ